MSAPSRSHALDVFILAALGLTLFFTNPRITFIDDEANIISTAAGPLASPLEHLTPTERHLQYPNCSRTMRSSRLCPGSNSICMEML